MPFEYKNSKWVCNHCKKEHDFRSDAENCYQLCKFGIDEKSNNPSNLMQYRGFSRKKKYSYNGREVEILSLYDETVFKTFYPVTIGYNDELSGWIGYLTIKQAENELNSCGNSHER